MTVSRLFLLFNAIKAFERSSGGHGYKIRRGTCFIFFIPCSCQTRIVFVFFED